MCTQPINLVRTNKYASTLSTRRRDRSALTAIFGAVALAAGFVAGTAALDASPVSHGASHGAPFSSVLAFKPAAYAFPGTNRTAKQDRVRVQIRNQGGIKRDMKDENNGSQGRRPAREMETKALIHCEPVGSPLADPAFRKMPPRSCLARLRTPWQSA
jgi:hypothetical protein